MIAIFTLIAFALLGLACIVVLADCAICGFNQSIWMREQVRLYRALNSGVRSTPRIAVTAMSKAKVEVIDPASAGRHIHVAA